MVAYSVLLPARLIDFQLRDYQVDGQIGLEPTVDAYVQKLVLVFREVRRVLRDDGVLWLNIDDSYNGSGGAGGDYNKGGKREGQPKYPGHRVAGLKPKDLIGVPWRVAFALQADGWYLRSDNIWAKSSCTPDSVKDRPLRFHEYVFLFSKSRQYFYRHGAGEKRSVWLIKSQQYRGAHFATYPEKLVEPCILAGTKEGDVVLDPFVGSGTTVVVAQALGRVGIGLDLNAAYLHLAHERLMSIQTRIIYGDS